MTNLTLSYLFIRAGHIYPSVSRVPAGSFRVSIIHQTLTWTTWSLTCVHDHSYACAYTWGFGAHWHCDSESAQHFWPKKYLNLLLCSWWGSNLGSPDLESDTLPTEPPHHPSNDCKSVLTGLSSEELSRLQQIQNSAARLVFKKSRLDYTTPLLLELHWLPVKYRIEYKIATFAFHHFNSTLPPYLNTYLPLSPPTNPPVLSGLVVKDSFLFPEQTPPYTVHNTYISVPHTQASKPTHTKKCDNTQWSSGKRSEGYWHGHQDSSISVKSIFLIGTSCG